MTTPSAGGLFGAIFGRGTDVGDAAWLRAMLDIEAALARALERAGLAVAGAGAAVTAAARAVRVDLDDLGVRAAATGNPVPALVRLLTAAVPDDPPGAAQAVHRGATSQDIIDTAMMLLTAGTLDRALADLADAADAAARLARAHASTPMAGRTLLQQAVPVTFGLVAAGWLTGLDEALAGLRRIRTERLAVQFGGAAGTLSALGAAGPAVVRLLADEIGLPAPVLPWHTNRVRIIDIAAALTAACAATGKVARDVTLLAQSEVAEVSEDPGGAGSGSAGSGSADPGGAGSGSADRGGSSAMPHKRNPVAAIAVLGCAKRAPGLLATLAAAAEQEHQRAAGAWHAEWETLTDLLRLTGSAAAWTAEMLTGLRADPARMSANLDAAGGLPLAESVAALLAPALGRIEAHDLVAAAARRAATGAGGLAEALFADPVAADHLRAAGIGREAVEAALRPESYLGAAAAFVDRALAAHPGRDDQRPRLTSHDDR
ncbi:MAG: lyase family protein [Streptosporangiaceae bacterium]